MRIGGRGWLAPGVEANGNVEGAETPPDLPPVVTAPFLKERLDAISIG